MSWHYAAKKFEVGEGIYEYSLVEVFPGLKAPTTKKFDTIQQEYSLEEVFRLTQKEQSQYMQTLLKNLILEK
jgi:hypothetical protein